MGGAAAVVELGSRRRTPNAVVTPSDVGVVGCHASLSRVGYAVASSHFLGAVLGATRRDESATPPLAVAAVPNILDTDAQLSLLPCSHPDVTTTAPDASMT